MGNLPPDIRTGGVGALFIGHAVKKNCTCSHPSHPSGTQDWVNYSINGPPNPKSRNLAPDGLGTHICESGASGGIDPPYPRPKML